MNIAHIYITPILEAYLRGLFRCPVGPVRLRESNYLGGFISRLVRTSTKPLATPQKGALALIIPDRGDRLLRNYFLYFSSADQQAIQILVEAFFHLELMSTINEARALGMDMKSSIQVFCTDHDVEGTRINYEVLRKRITRERQRVRKILKEQTREYPAIRLVRDRQ